MGGNFSWVGEDIWVAVLVGWVRIFGWQLWVGEDLWLAILVGWAMAFGWQFWLAG